MKYKTPFPFRNYAKLIFNTNQVPETEDKTDAFYRRVNLIEFPNKFVIGENADTTLFENIPEREYEVFAWKLVEILKKLRERGFTFSQHKKVEIMAVKYEALSNPLDRIFKPFESIKSFYK